MENPARALPILLYHSIATTTSAKFHPFAVPPMHFAEHLAYLAEQGYTALTVSRCLQLCSENKEELPDLPVVITFDDGFADFYTDALPLLQYYGFTATLYVTTKFVGETARWLRHQGEASRQMITWENLADVDRAGIECGGHSHTHRSLDILSEAEAWQEVVRCKDELQEHLGHSVMSFAYPFGRSTARIRRQVALAGYSSACIVGHCRSSSQAPALTLPRFLVTPEMTGQDIGRMITRGRLMEMGIGSVARTRTALWSLVRRGSTLVNQSRQKGVSK